MRGWCWVSAASPATSSRRSRSPRWRLLAAAAHLLIGAGRHPWRAVTFVRSFAVVNVAFATGWINVLRGREIEVWHRADFTIDALIAPEARRRPGGRADYAGGAFPPGWRYTLDPLGHLP